jgi:hypothetical protein
MFDGGQRSIGRWRWQVGAGPNTVVGGGRRKQVAVTHRCVLCHLTPCRFFHLCQQQQWHWMMMQQWVQRPLAGDVNVDSGGNGEGG